MHHLLALDPEREAVVHCGCCGNPQRRRVAQGLLSKKVAGVEQRDGGLLALVGNYALLGATLLKTKYCVCRISLGEKRLLRFHFNNPLGKPDAGKKRNRFKRLAALGVHHNTSSLKRLPPM